MREHLQDYYMGITNIKYTYAWALTRDGIAQNGPMFKNRNRTDEYSAYFV